MQGSPSANLGSRLSRDNEREQRLAETLTTARAKLVAARKEARELVHAHGGITRNIQDKYAWLIEDICQLEEEVYDLVHLDD